MVYKIRKNRKLIFELWYQINESADYVRTGDKFKYIQKVGNDIDKLLQEANSVIVIAHSMGEYLSYCYLKQKDSDTGVEKIHLLGVGGGLGLVSLVGKLRASDKNGKIAPLASVFVSLYAAFFAIISAAASIAVWWGFSLDLSRLVPVIYGVNKMDELLNASLGNPIYLFETNSWRMNIMLHFSMLLCLLGLRKFILQFIGIDKLNFNKFKFYKYSHPCDPVGNSASFLYEDLENQSITPNGWFAHGISTYFGKFDKNGNMVAVSSEAEEYMRVRTVQHISHSLSIAPLPEVNLTWLKVIVYGMSTLVAPIFGLWIMSGFKMTVAISVLPIAFFIPNCFVAMILSWMVSKAIEIRPKSPGTLNWFDYFFICFCSLSMSFIATALCLIFVDSILP